MKAVKVDRGGKEVPSRTNDGLEVPTLHQWCQDVICNGTRAAEGTMQELCEWPGLILVEYADGFRGGVLMLNGFVSALSYAARMGGGRIEACEFHCDGHGGPPNNDRRCIPAG